MNDPAHPAKVPDRTRDARPCPAELRTFTTARVALASTDISVTTHHALEFAQAHALARDAVHSALAVPSLLAALRERNLLAIHLRSAAASRTEYLRRPDLGRALAPASEALIAAQPAVDKQQPATHLTLILADGLSALATERHALFVVDALLPLLDSTWQLTPVVIAEQARVALADPIGLALRADATVILIGERPGLSSPDSLGAYVTWAPRLGRTDAERNCVSNIRTAGLSYAAAGAKIAWYLSEGRRMGVTGIAIRESDAAHAARLDP